MVRCIYLHWALQGKQSGKKQVNDLIPSNWLVTSEVPISVVHGGPSHTCRMLKKVIEDDAILVASFILCKDHEAMVTIIIIYAVSEVFVVEVEVHACQNLYLY